MSETYTGVEAIWNRHVGGAQSKTKDDVVALLASQRIRLRQDDGELKQVTLSKPASGSDAFVIGLRYQKNDESHSEDLFFVKKDCPLESHYKGSLEHKLQEYRGTHKQPVLSVLMVDVPLTPTEVNTLSVLTKR